MKLIVMTRRPSETEPGLQGFPFENGQYIEEVEPSLHYDVVIIEMGNRNDTTTAQEQFLNTHPGVIKYYLAKET